MHSECCHVSSYISWLRSVLESDGSVHGTEVSEDPCLGSLGRFHWQVLHSPDAMAWHCLCSPREGSSWRGTSLHPALELHKGTWWFYRDSVHVKRDSLEEEKPRGLARRSCGGPSALVCLVGRGLGSVGKRKRKCPWIFTPQAIQSVER